MTRVPTRWLGRASAALALLALSACGDEAPSGPPGPFVPTPAQVAAHNAALGLMGKFEFEDAAKPLAGLVEAAPRWVAARVNLAIALLNTQSDEGLTQAQAELARVLAEEPGNLRARFTLGLILYHRAQLKSALGHFEAVAAGDRDDAYAAFWVGNVLSLLDRNEEALASFRRAVALDPLLRSGWYGAFSTLNVLDRAEDAKAMLAEYERLENHPLAHLAELKYSRMGPKAMAQAWAAPAPAPPATSGPLRAEEPAPLAVGGRAVAWSAAPGPLTTADVDGDGFQDLFLEDAETTPAGTRHLLLRGSAGGFLAGPAHPLEAVGGVRAVLWGDLDNDGRVDAYLCRKGENALFLQREGGRFEDVTTLAKAGGGPGDTVDGILADLDHDGDLDVYCVNADGPNELLSNNLDGTFRPLGASSGVGGDGRPSVAAVAVDLDGDRDLDLVVLHAAPPHETFWNERLWAWTPEPRGLEALLASAGPASIVAADADGDGVPELYVGTKGAVERWSRGAGGAWRRAPLLRKSLLDTVTPPVPTRHVAVADLDGDGRLDLVARCGLETHATGLGAGPEDVWLLVDGNEPFALVTDGARAPLLLTPRPSQPPQALRFAAGPNRFAGLAFSGKRKDTDQMRSNASGIGVRAVVQVGTRATVVSNQRAQSGPGQSLGPVLVGLGSAERIDFVNLLWPDGLFQTETLLDAGRVHRIEEVQRQTSSCPVLFCWDGTKHAFVTDLLGVGGIGFLVEPGTYAPPLPREHVLLPEGLPVAKDGRFVLKLSEPMEETCYLDHADLVAWDLPQGVSLVLDERMGVLGPAPTSEPRFVTREALPIKATDGSGADVTEAVRRADRRAAPAGEPDGRFLGRVKGSVLTLEFAEALDAGPGAPLLVADGWVEYPYAQTVFAAWQAQAPYLAPTLEARGADGAWKVVQEQLGYPAGMPRTMSFPLAGLPPGTRALRLTGTYEVYWDRIAVGWAEPCPGAVRRGLARRVARLEAGGFARRTTGPQRLPHYDWEKRAPLWDCRPQRGLHTRFGDVEALLAATDDALVVFGPGEDVHLEYDASLPPCPPGMTRRFVLETTGWCKDSDLYTKDGDTVGPLPRREGVLDARARDVLHATTLTRPGR